MYADFAGHKTSVTTCRHSTGVVVRRPKGRVEEKTVPLGDTSRYSSWGNRIGCRWDLFWESWSRRRLQETRWGLRLSLVSLTMRQQYCDFCKADLTEMDRWVNLYGSYHIYMRDITLVSSSWPYHDRRSVVEPLSLLPNLQWSSKTARNIPMGPVNHRGDLWGGGSSNTLSSCHRRHCCWWWEDGSGGMGMDKTVESGVPSSQGSMIRVRSS